MRSQRAQSPANFERDVELAAVVYSQHVIGHEGSERELQPKSHIIESRSSSSPMRQHVTFAAALDRRMCLHHCHSRSYTTPIPEKKTALPPPLRPPTSACPKVFPLLYTDSSSGDRDTYSA